MNLSTKMLAPMVATSFLLFLACASSTTVPDGGNKDVSESDGAGGDGDGGGADGATTCDPSYTCATALAPPAGDPSKLCADTLAGATFATLNTCVCVTKCAAICADSACAQRTPATACLTCIMDMTAGCGKESAACIAN